MATAIRTIARYTLLEAMRSRLLMIMVILLLASLGLAQFLQHIALTETRQIQALFMASFLRLSAVVVLALVVITHFSRELKDQGLALLLSTAISRTDYLLGKFVGFAVVGVLLALGLSLPLYGFTSPQGAFVWTLSLIGELWIIAAISILFAVSLSQVVGSILAVMAFYLLARSIDSLQLLSHGDFVHPDRMQAVWGWVVALIAWLLPQLDHFTRSDWLIYSLPQQGDLAKIAIQTVVYLALLLLAALVDFYRKNF